MLDIDKKTENGGSTPQGRLSAQEFNQVVDAINTLDGTRIGATFFDSGTTTQYQFASIADRDAWLADRTQSHLVIGTDTFALTGRMTQLSIIDYMGGSLLYFATHAQKAEITVGFKSEEKSVTDTAWNEVIEDARFTVYVDKGKTGDFSIVAEDIDVFYGQNLTFDVFKYIATGENRVRFVANGKLSGAVATRTYEVNLTTMYLTAPADMGWHVPFVEGDPFALLFNIGGNINKVLHARVTAEGYEHNYTVNIGTATYVNNTYPLRAIQFPSAENNQLPDSTRDNFTGVYTVEVWLDANGLTSDVITRQIICVASADKTTAKLVCVNQVANPVYNGDTSTLFLYSLYNGGVGGQSDIEVTATVENNTIINKSLEVTTGQLLEFIDAVDYEIDSADALRIAFNVTHGNTVTWNVPLDNTYAYPPVTGYTFYMNEDTRSNGEANREFIINQADGSQVETEWNRIAFVGDGHNVDDQGRKCLHIPAGSSATVKQTFMFNIPAAGKTIEMAFKIANAADFEENVISIFGENGAGLQIKPRNVKLYSQKKQSSEYDLAQSYNIKDEEFVHMVVTIIPQYKGNYGRLAQIYINGVKKTSFEFDEGDSFQTSGFLQLGSLTADLYLYRMRIYDSGFEWPAVVQNFVNCLPSRTEKVHVWNRIRSILNDADVVDYDTCVRAGLNTMVIEMLDGASLPDKLHPTEEAVPNCNVTFNVYNRREDELDNEMFQLLGGLKLENQPIEGQGTTAMTYYRWNFRWKLSKIIDNKRRITAKKNVASSPHSHKMGATRMFNELHNAVVEVNEVNGRVAVAQYPVYGFLAKPVDGAPGEYAYEYIGLYTVGPDKGDAHSFGYDNATYEGSIIHLEGTDHNVTGVGFDYPWITFTGPDGNEESTMVYDPAAEGLSVVGKQSNATPWEVGQAGELETDSTADADAVYAMLVQELKPAYDCVYNCSTTIMGTTATLEDINANPAAWRETLAPDGRKYSSFEFWTDGVYDLYYYNAKYERYMPNGINLLAQLGVDAATLAGMTTEQKNEHFKTLRRNIFKSTWTNYWDAEDAIFHDVFLELIGATDNFKKNNYPYKLKPLAQGGRWKRRQDDLDTIFDINNQGYATKKYSILMGDTTDSGSVFRGEDSIFHTLVKECFPEEKKEMAHRIFDKMAELSKHGENSITRLIGYVRTCCWDYAQEYFTESAYNTDAEWTYEDAWALWGDEYQNDVNPLQQSLGSHYEAEKNWVELRMVFMASYYNWGPFAKDSGEDNAAGTVSFRAASGKSFTLTPAIDFNPTILIGQNDLRYAGGRNEAGTPVTVVVPDMGQNDTHIYIQGTDYLYDLGNLSDLQLSTDNSTLAVSAKRLRTLKVGDEDASKVSSNVTLLNMGSNPALEELDARNMATLNNATVDLTGCPRIRRAYFKGTNVKGVRLVSGSKITELTLPDTITGLTLVGLPYLTTENLDYGSLANVVNLHVENSPYIDPFEMLRKAFDASTSLAGIRIVNFMKENGTVDDVNMLYTLATAMDESGMNKKYQGLDANGSLVTGSIPVVNGKLTLSEIPYENEFNPANELFPGVMEPANGVYINFADPNLEAIIKLKTTGLGGDDTGVTLDEAKSFTTFSSSKFYKNATITSFDELAKYENVTTLGSTSSNSYLFYACTKLESVKLPPRLKTIQTATFSSCTALKEIEIPSTVVSIISNAFNGCSGLTAVYITDLVAWLNIAFDNANANPLYYAKNLYLNGELVEDLVIPDGVISIGRRAFYNATCLKSVSIPNTIATIGSDAFYGCSGLTAVHISDLLAWTNINFANSEANPLYYAKKLYLNGELVEDLVIPDGVTAITSLAFYKASSLKSVTVPISLKTIGDSAVRDCINLVSINMSSVEKIGNYAFYGCTRLKTVICRAITPPTIQSTTFGNTGSRIFYVPDESVDAYKAATNWNTYASYIKPLSEYVES